MFTKLTASSFSTKPVIRTIWWGNKICYRTVAPEIPLHILQGFHYSRSTLDSVFYYHSSNECSNCPPISEWYNHYFGLNYVSLVQETCDDGAFFRQPPHVIRELVDSLRRDGANRPIVCVHRKAFLTHECLHSKPFWATSYSIPVFLYQKYLPSS